MIHRLCVADEVQAGGLFGGIAGGRCRLAVVVHGSGSPSGELRGWKRDGGGRWYGANANGIAGESLQPGATGGKYIESIDVSQRALES